MNIMNEDFSGIRYVVQCYISDKTGKVVTIDKFTVEQILFAYRKAVEYYKGVLPVPDNGEYKNYTL